MESAALQIALTVINALILIVVGAGGFIIKNLSNRISLLEADISDVKKDQNVMKVNYLDRFADAKEHTTKEIQRVLEAVNELKVNYAQLNHKQ